MIYKKEEKIIVDYHLKNGDLTLAEVKRITSKFGTFLSAQYTIFGDIKASIYVDKSTQNQLKFNF